MRALVLACRAERLATTSTRTASTAPSLDFGLPLGPATQSGSRCFDGVEGIGLAAAAALLSVGPVDFDDLDAGPTQVASQARAIRTGSLDADLGDVTEALEPSQQRLVAGRVGEKRSEPSSPPRDRGLPPHGRRGACRRHRSHHAQLLRWSWSSLLSKVLRDGTAVPDRSDGRSGLFLATRTNHPNSETGRAAFNVRLEGLGRRHPNVSRDSKSGRTRQHSRNYLGPAIKRWTLREVSMYWGTLRVSPRVRKRIVWMHVHHPRAVSRPRRWL